jgi:uncharacterized protein YdaU (DUF1376 family)
LNYYERHIGDYTKDTSHLSLLEHGVYARLLDVYYLRESGIPKDQVYRLIGARAKAERAAVDGVLSEFFELVDGVWIQKRCQEVIAEYHRFLEKQAAAGRASAAKRAFNTGSTTVQPPLDSGTNQTPNQIQPPTSHSPLPNPKSRSAAPVETETDPRKTLFDLGKQILGASSGGVISQAIARTSEAKVGEVLGHMALSAKADPKAYFIAATTPQERRVAV